MVNMQYLNQNHGNLSPNTSLKSKVSISSIKENKDPQSIEFVYSYIIRCCLFPFKQSTTDLYCNQKIGTKFRSYIYKKKLGMIVKPPKSGTNNNIDGISKYLYSISLQDFYKNMEESSNFKDYIIFFAQIVNIQIKKYKTTYRLTDENNDSIIIDSVHSFVKIFKEFAAKHLENFNESQYDIFQEKVYLSCIISFLQVPSNIDSLMADNDIQNWARKIFKIDSQTHQNIVNTIKRTINQKVSNRHFIQFI